MISEWLGQGLCGLEDTIIQVHERADHGLIMVLVIDLNGF